MLLIDPEQVLQGGFEVRGYFNIDQLEAATSFYDNYLSYLCNKGIQPTSASFSGSTDSPNIVPNFTIHLMGTFSNQNDVQQDEEAIFCLGYAQAFAKFNRPKGVRVGIHPNSSKQSQNVSQDILNYTERAMWASDDAPPPCLSLEFFDNLLKVQEKKKSKKRISFKRSKSFVGFTRALNSSE